VGREVRVRYRLDGDPQTRTYWAGDLDLLEAGQVARVIAELADDPTVVAVWLECRDVQEWRRSTGSELLEYGYREEDMSIAAYLDHAVFTAYQDLRQAGKLDVLSTDPNVEGEARHAISEDGGETRTVTTSELVDIIKRMGANQEGDKVE
jgi:hypothetical protein